MAEPVETEITVVVVQGERITYWRLDPDADGLIHGQQSLEGEHRAVVKIEGTATRVILTEDTAPSATDVLPETLAKIADSLSGIEAILSVALNPQAKD